MDTPILDALTEFSYKLQEISKRSSNEIEFTVPIDIFRNLEYELIDARGISFNLSTPQEHMTKGITVLINGDTIKISCKEQLNYELQSKLQQCFKILSK
jgi:hypothetical protein